MSLGFTNHLCWHSDTFYYLYWYSSDLLPPICAFQQSKQVEAFETPSKKLCASCQPVYNILLSNCRHHHSIVDVLNEMLEVIENFIQEMSQGQQRLWEESTSRNSAHISDEKGGCSPVKRGMACAPRLLRKPEQELHWKTCAVHWTEYSCKKRQDFLRVFEQLCVAFLGRQAG